MSAGALFGVNFLAYAIVFVIVVALVVAACFIGIKWKSQRRNGKGCSWIHGHLLL